MMTKTAKYLAAFTLFLSITSCYTLHTPTYHVSVNDEFLPPKTAQIKAQTTRNYFLGFGGKNKKPMMAEARILLNDKRSGFLPNQFINVSVDEEKTNYFFLYYQHKLIISANLNFATKQYESTTNSAIQDVATYNLTQGDRITFKYDDGVLLHQSLLGTVKWISDKIVHIELDEASKNNKLLHSFSGYANLKDVNLLTQNKADFKQNDVVAFMPRGYGGSPIVGVVHGFYNSTTVKLKLNPESIKTWQKFGGKRDEDGIIYVPVFRVFK